MITRIIHVFMNLKVSLASSFAFDLRHDRICINNPLNRQDYYEQINNNKALKSRLWLG